MSLAQEKFAYVVHQMDAWELNVQERRDLFLIDGDQEVIWDEIIIALPLLDIEARCDLIYEILVNLTQVYGQNMEQHARWLRAPIRPLDNQSPLAFLKGGNVETLQRLVVCMQGP